MKGRHKSRAFVYGWGMGMASSSLFKLLYDQGRVSGGGFVAPLGMVSRRSRVGGASLREGILSEMNATGIQGLFEPLSH